MDRFNIDEGKNKIIIFSTTVLILLLTILLSYLNPPITDLSKNFVNTALSPLNTGFSYVFNFIGEGKDFLFGNSNLRSKNNELELKNQELEKEIALYQSVIANTEYLENEFNMLKNASYNLLPAVITSMDPKYLSDDFTINKGSKDGVKKGDIVVSAVKYTDSRFIEGIVGYIKDVGENWALVNSSLNDKSSITFYNTRNLENGSLSGRSNDGLYGYVFESNSDIKKGDKLMTSGYGGVYPRDIYIGDVVDVKMNEELVAQIIVDPVVNFDKLFRVYVMDRNEGIYEQN